MELAVIYNDINWLLIIDDYDYIEAQRESGPSHDSGGEPGFTESIELNEYHLEIDLDYVCHALGELINAQLSESNRLADHIVDFYCESIHDKLLAIHKTLLEDF